MRFRAADLQPHSWQPLRTLHIPDWCGCTREHLPMPTGGGWLQMVPIWDLDLRAETLRLDPGMTKNGEGRVVYLTPELRGLLGEQLERVDQVGRKAGQIIPWLFPYLSGQRWIGQRRRTFVKVWVKACEKAQVPGRILHDFRRTAVRNLERASVPRSVAMKLTGHKTESVSAGMHRQ